MNSKIYDAQLSVSKIINDDLVNDLVSRLSIIGPSSYNIETKCVDIDMKTMALVEHDDTIRTILREWLFDMDLDKEIYNILSNNVEILYNITKTGYPNIQEHIIHVYLY